MTPSHAVRGAKRYRYYITQGSELREGEPAASRVPARDLERAVLWRLQQLLRDKAELRRLIATDANGAELAGCIAAASNLAEQLDDSSKRRTLIKLLARRVEVHETSIRIGLVGGAVRRLLHLSSPPRAEGICVETAAVKIRHGSAVKLVITDGTRVAPQCDARLLELLREAHAARAQALANPHRSIEDIADEQRQCRHRLARLVRLSWLAPAIVSAIFEGRHPAGLTPKRLLTLDLPMSWSEQKVLLGFA